MKNSADLGGCSALVDNTLLDLRNSSYPNRPHSIIAKYGRWFLIVKSGKNPSVTAIEQYLHVVLFIMLHKVVLKSVYKTLVCDHSNET